MYECYKQVCFWQKSVCKKAAFKILVKLRPALLVGGLVGAGVVGTTSGELLKKNSNPVQKENKCIIKK